MRKCFFFANFFIILARLMCGVNLLFDGCFKIPCFQIPGTFYAFKAFVFSSYFFFFYLSKLRIISVVLFFTFFGFIFAVVVLKAFKMPFRPAILHVCWESSLAVIQR